ncbi:MAG: hypothetical protein CME70_21600 [Halobacteriovorax sp.]|nr:hypothetical protein [Halobacteriovorax sp.]|tara:strand:+ start:23728 stop:25086 length:1359 start_codon:yes stop_codon:yes gene_type:complete
MKKVQIFLESDIIIRHFILNDTFKEIERECSVQYIISDDHRVQTPIDKLNLKNVKLIKVNRKRLGKMRQLIKALGLRKIQDKPKYQFLKDIWKGILPEKSYKRIKLYSHPLIFPIYRFFTLLLLGNYPELEEAVDDFKPDVILHPCVLEGLFISDLISTSKKRNIPFVVLMNSWDNPSTKATVLGLPDYLVVWGEQTMSHAIEFMDMPADKIKKFGAAQFEVYKAPPLKTRKQYCQEASIDPEKTLIIYAGSSKSINEIEHLQTLENAIQSGDITDTHIIFKPHPWRATPEGEPDFFSIDWKHISMDPGMVPYYKRSVEKNDDSIQLSSYMDTHIILSSADILISNVSTILLEAALHGMPIMCMVSDKEIEENNFLRVTLNSLYFNDLMERLDVARCKDHQEIVIECKKLIDKFMTPDFKDKQIEKTKFFVELKEKSYGQQVFELIKNIGKG